MPKRSPSDTFTERPAPFRRTPSPSPAEVSVEEVGQIAADYGPERVRAGAPGRRDP